MSETYYYRLKGEALKRSKQFQKNLERLTEERDTEKIPHFIEVFGIPKDAEFLYHTCFGTEDITGFKSEHVPPGFRRDRYGYVVPDRKTKIGKEANKDLESMRLLTTDLDTLEYLGAPTEIFRGLGVLFTSTRTIGRWHVLTIGKQIDHPDCQEVTLGAIRKEFEQEKGENRG